MNGTKVERLPEVALSIILVFGPLLEFEVWVGEDIVDEGEKFDVVVSAITGVADR